MNHFLLLSLAGLCLVGTGCVSRKPTAYTIEEQGRRPLRTMLDRKLPTSAEQWEYARETQNKGKLKKAERGMLYLVKRWPNSKEAPLAQRARADMFYARGELEEAFSAYQYLINNYSSRMLDYDSVLESQFEIAKALMDRKRMRWLFGGYRAPEYSVEYFEDVIRNGPQWDRAPEAQFLIGQAYQDSKQLEMAIAAYAVLGYRYPGSFFAEDAAWRQIECLELLRRDYPSSPDILERTLTSTTVFLSTYPGSKHKGDIIQLRNNLYEVKAKKAFDEADFYARVPKKPESAILYYRKMIREYPKSKLVPEAEKRITELEALMASTGPVVTVAEKGADDA